MKIIDTVVLISSLDPEHPLYKDAIKHLQSVIFSEEIYVPSAILLECDLVLKGKGFSKEERAIIFERLTRLIPKNKILPITVSVLKRTANLEDEKQYFDALIASTALEHAATIISTDHIFPEEGITTVW